MRSAYPQAVSCFIPFITLSSTQKNISYFDPCRCTVIPIFARSTSSSLQLTIDYVPHLLFHLHSQLHPESRGDLQYPNPTHFVRDVFESRLHRDSEPRDSISNPQTNKIQVVLTRKELCLQSHRAPKAAFPSIDSDN